MGDKDMMLTLSSHKKRRLVGMIAFPPAVPTLGVTTSALRLLRALLGFRLLSRIMKRVRLRRSGLPTLRNAGNFHPNGSIHLFHERRRNEAMMENIDLDSRTVPVKLGKSGSILNNRIIKEMFNLARISQFVLRELIELQFRRNRWVSSESILLQKMRNSQVKVDQGLYQGSESLRCCVI
jgi:hypothetical protein